MIRPSAVSLPLGPLMVDLGGMALTAEERNFLLHPAVGAVILFGRNYESPGQVAELVREIKSLRSPSILVAVDQEGGRVQRFREGFYALPALYALGLLHQEDALQAKQLAGIAGRLMAAELRKVNVDFSFAPVLDTASLDSQVIGDRAIHADAAIITALSREYIMGMSSSGMMATGKHFPGHGGVQEDSHLETPVDTRSFEELWQTDLAPYQSLASVLGGVMTAHVQFPAIDEHLPAYSEYWIRQVLRHQIGFRGAVFTDDLTMQGAAIGQSPASRAQLALAAGCDVVLVCNDFQATREVADHLGRGPSTHNPALSKMAGLESQVDDGVLSRWADELQPLFELA